MYCCIELLQLQFHSLHTVERILQYQLCYKSCLCIVTAPACLLCQKQSYQLRTHIFPIPQAMSLTVLLLVVLYTFVFTMSNSCNEDYILVSTACSVFLNILRHMRKPVVRLSTVNMIFDFHATIDYFACNEDTFFMHFMA